MPQSVKMNEQRPWVVSLTFFTTLLILLRTVMRKLPTSACNKPRLSGRVMPVLMFFSILFATRISAAGDVWVYPQKFSGISGGDTLSIQVGRGQAFPESEEPVISEKLKLRVYSSGGSEYLLPLKKQERFWDSEFTVKREGAHLIVADITEDYWSKSGEKWVNLPKSKVPASKQSIAFWYFSKAVISHKNDNSLYGKDLGYSLEIIPLDNPALIKPGAKMRLKVLFEGKPASGVPIEYTYVGFSKNPENKMGTGLTDRDGIVEIPIRRNGLWYVTTKKYTKETGNIQYDTASYLSNLIFQIDPAVQ